MSAFISLNRASFTLPDGRTLFSDLSHTFAGKRIGLVGINGVGKSVLGRLVAGLANPSTGSISRSGSVYYLAQEPDPSRFSTVAALAGMDARLAALARITQGGLDEHDYALVADHWDCETVLRGELADMGLANLQPDTPTSQLSGGERQRIALLGAFLSGADFLVLDEPTNHLDSAQRAQFACHIQRCSAGVLLISHDEGLLECVDEIVELSASGLRAYGGNYSLYVEQRNAEQRALTEILRSERAAVKREQREAAQQLDRQQRRAAQGERLARDANQSSLLLGARQERSENSMGRLRQQQQAQRQAWHERVATAQAQVVPEIARLLFPPDNIVPRGTQVLQLDHVQLPFGSANPINLVLKGPCRMAIKGGNGSGKSTLMKIIARQVGPVAGSVRCLLQTGWLDQHAGLQHPDLSPLQWLQMRNNKMSQTELRARLAELGIDTARSLLPTRQLSGGERIKTALAAEIYANPAPQILLLDEPDNHLDLPSKAALQTMLNQFRGALLVISHDQYFLDGLRLDGEIGLE